MKKNIKMVSDIYGVMLDLKSNYEKLNLTITLQEYIKLEMRGLQEEAILWLAEDEREKQEI